MVAGAVFVLDGSLTTGGFVAFLLLVGVFLPPAGEDRRGDRAVPARHRGASAATRSCWPSRPDVADAPGAVPAPELTGRVTLEGLTFGYDPDRPVLRGVSLDVAAGETVAFVGPSGAGKTTLLALVPRFYDPQAGCVRLDGIDTRTLTLASLRRQIGIVSQDVFLFGGTLRENIAYGRLGATEAEIREAAGRARLSEVIAGLPQGLDTVVGERGVTLSGGQKQRVAIARIFLRDPAVLILDEATSALDTETEREIQRRPGRPVGEPHHAGYRPPAWAPSATPTASW